MLPFGDCCVLEFHILTGDDEVPGESTTLTIVCQTIQDSSIHPTLVPQMFSEFLWVLEGRSGAEQKTLTCHALWENSTRCVCVWVHIWGWGVCSQAKGKWEALFTEKSL